MISLKKQYQISKIQQLFNKNSIIIFYQYNHISMKDWDSIKLQLQNSQNLVIKNTLIYQALKKRKDFTNNFKIHKNLLIEIFSLFQGPTLLIVCNSIGELKEINNVLEKNSKFLFLGGFFESQIINHLDFKKILEIDNTTIRFFLEIFTQKMQTLQLLHQGLDISFLRYIQINFLQCLNTLKSISINKKD